MNNLTFKEQAMLQLLTNISSTDLDNKYNSNGVGWTRNDENAREKGVYYGRIFSVFLDGFAESLNSSFKRTGEMFRQGDVLIAKINAIPLAALPAPYEHNHAVLAHGEVTGHKHQLKQDEAQLFAMNDNMFLRIVTPMGYVRHEEHSPIALAQGDYQVIKQREASDDDDVVSVKD